jgi:hypothetical protein
MILAENRTGADRSDKMILAEQAKSLPASIGGPANDNTSATADFEAQVHAATGKTSREILDLVTQAENQGSDFLTTLIQTARERSYKAFRNEHGQGSKYFSPRFRNRSRLFKPKTRSAVRKNNAAAAAALFSSADVVLITPQDESSPTQRASADLKKEILNYRLDRHGPHAIPWFQTSIGAHQDAQIAAICVTKHFWIYKERVLTWKTFKDETGEERRVPGETKVVHDRPECLNVKPENVIFDPNCDWRRPAQSSGYFLARYPMPLHELRQMMKPRPFGGETWLPIAESELASLTGGPAPSSAQSVQTARAGGQQTDANRIGDYRIMWVYEAFLNIDGEDYQFWTLGKNKLLSVPRPTYVAYPEQDGERPYVVGFGALETHQPLPMSPVESWQPLQQEANDVANLRLDQMKQVVNPSKKVKRGRQVDLNAVNAMGQDTVLMLQDPEKDVMWDRPPDVPASAFAEANYIASDFDELAGNFATSSVMQNRSLNETVGGMKLMAGAAGSVTEFDLRLWIETWAEPAVTQILRCIEFYEDNVKILAMAGQKAELIEKYGINEITDQLIREQVTLKINVGLGSADPMQKLEKFRAGAGIIGELAAGFAGSAPLPAPNWEEVVNEVMGAAGYKNAFSRFFQPTDGQQLPPAPPPDPVAVAKAEAEQRKVAVLEAQAAKDAEEKDRRFKLEETVALHGMEKGEREMDRADRQHALQEVTTEADLREKGSERALKFDAHRTQKAQADREHEFKAKSADREHDFKKTTSDREHSFKSKTADREHDHKVKTGDRDHSFAREQFDDSKKARGETRSDTKEGRDAEHRMRRAEKGIKQPEREQAEDGAIKAVSTGIEAMTKASTALATAASKMADSAAAMAKPKTVTTTRDAKGNLVAKIG